MLHTHEVGHPVKCVRSCTAGKNGVPCPEKFSCAGSGTTDKGEKQHWCMANEAPPPSVQCKPPEVMAYAADRNDAICGSPCKADSECGKGNVV